MRLQVLHIWISGLLTLPTNRSPTLLPIFLPSTLPSLSDAASSVLKAAPKPCSMDHTNGILATPNGTQSFIPGSQCSRITPRQYFLVPVPGMELGQAVSKTGVIHPVLFQDHSYVLCSVL